MVSFFENGEGGEMVVVFTCYFSYRPVERSDQVRRTLSVILSLAECGKKNDANFRCLVVVFVSVICAPLGFANHAEFFLRVLLS
jgi:hypothetical protein